MHQFEKDIKDMVDFLRDNKKGATPEAVKNEEIKIYRRALQIICGSAERVGAATVVQIADAALRAEWAAK